jgi:acyl-CoA synthetase (AMP-forming)/AMP-acid ligase II
VSYNIADLVEHAVDLMPDRVALADDGREVTYAQLEERANKLAHYLQKQGVQPGDKVGIYSRNTIEAVEAMVAIFKARAVMINVNFRYVENELQYIFDNSDMVALIHERRYSDRVAGVRPKTPQLRTVVVVDDDTTGTIPTAADSADYETVLAQSSGERDFGERSPDDLYMVYTGGTTGMPKGVMWRQEDVWRVLGAGINFITGEYVQDEWELAKVGAGSPPMVRFPIPPMIHGGAQWATFHSLFGGRVLRARRVAGRRQAQDQSDLHHR